MLQDRLMIVPGLIRANGPTVELSPMVAPKIIVLGFNIHVFPNFTSI